MNATSREWIIFRPSCIAMVTLVLFCSCNFYRFREGQVVSKFRQAGLVPKTFVSQDTTIRYWVGGSGEPLLLIHGFGADSTFQWYEQVGLLSKTHTLIVPDLVYFGSSSSKSGLYSVDFQADILIKLLAVLHVDQLTIMGISYGGLVGATIADRMPGRVRKIIICDSPIKFYSRADNERALVKYNAKTIQDLLIPERPEDIPRLLELAQYRPMRVPAFVLKNIHENMFKNQSLEKSRLLDFLANNEKEFMNRKYTIDCEILLVWGRYDFLIPPIIGEKLKDYFKPRARLEIIDETAHMPNIERPERFNAVIMEFLTGHH